uniref:Testis-specific X-linked protein n=1 Tax=Globodera pallida TaxID=36090 RepID=A0A183CMN3_GLOPA
MDILWKTMPRQMFKKFGLKFGEYLNEWSMVEYLHITPIWPSNGFCSVIIAGSPRLRPVRRLLVLRAAASQPNCWRGGRMDSPRASLRPIAHCGPLNSSGGANWALNVLPTRESAPGAGGLNLAAPPPEGPPAPPPSMGPQARAPPVRSVDDDPAQELADLEEEEWELDEAACGLPGTSQMPPIPEGLALREAERYVVIDEDEWESCVGSPSPPASTSGAGGNVADGSDEKTGTDDPTPPFL